MGSTSRCTRLPIERNQGSELPKLDEDWSTLVNGFNQMYIEMKVLNYLQYFKLVTILTKCIDSITRHFSVSHPPRSRQLNGVPCQRESNSVRGYQVYNKIIDFVEEYTKTLSKKYDDLENDDAILFYLKEWRSYNFTSEVIGGITTYLEIYWMARENKLHKWHLPTVYDLTVLSWADNLLSIIQPKLTGAALKLIESERNGQRIDTGLISRLIESYLALEINTNPTIKRKIYKCAFEKDFLRETKEFYAKKSSNYLIRNTIPEYLKRVEEWSTEEKKRIQKYLCEETQKPMVVLLDGVLLDKYLPQILDEFQIALTANRDEDLQRMYRLLSKNKYFIKKIENTFKEYVILQGEKAIKKYANDVDKKPEEYVEALVEIFYKYKALILSSFSDDEHFNSALENAYEQFINHNEVTRAAEHGSAKSSELLAKYCHYLLKKNNKNITEHVLEEKLAQVIQIFKLLPDKDVFQTWHKQLLTTRLLSAKSASDDAEVSFISKLKITNGYEYTRIFEKMINDITSSKELTEGFRTSPSGNKQTLGLDFSVQVLGAGVWTCNAISTFLIPRELEKSTTNFTSFYVAKHSKRKLTYLLHKSSGELVTNFLTNQYTLQMTTLQMAMLMQYNDRISFTVRQLCQNIELQNGEAMALQIIGIFLRSKLMTCIENVADLNMDSEVKLNMEYRSNKLRINLKTPFKADVNKEKKERDEAIESNRNHKINAAIVRIMKMRRTMNHNELVAEVLTQLSPRFKPTMKGIKRSIDFLIERDYVARGEELNTYKYLA